MSEYPLKVAFDDIKAKAFLSALKDLQRLGINQIVFDAPEDKTINIAAANESNSILAFVNFKEAMLDKSKFSEETQLGIYDLSEFCSYLSVFADGFGWSVGKRNCLIKKSPNSLHYDGCLDPKLIKKVELKINPEEIASFNFDCQDMKSFIKALSVMQQGFVIITGDPDSNEIKFSITDKDISTTSFDAVVEVENLEQPIRCVVTKESLSPVMKSGFENLEIVITKPFIKLTGRNDYFDETIIIAVQN